MKNTVLLLSFFLTAQILFAQISFEKGYIITLLSGKNEELESLM